MSLFSWLFSESENSRGVERGKNTGEGNSQKSRHYDLHPNEQVSARQTGNSVVLAAEGGKAQRSQLCVRECYEPESWVSDWEAEGSEFKTVQHLETHCGRPSEI